MCNLHSAHMNGKLDETFSAIVLPWAAKLSLKSPLSKITLSNILAGDTCDPISLSNLEGYLAFREHSLQNLQFVVWFQDYHKRFFNLPESEQALSPAPCEYGFSLPIRFSTESRFRDPVNEFDFHVAPRRLEGFRALKGASSIKPLTSPSTKTTLSPSVIPTTHTQTVPRPLASPALLNESSNMKLTLPGNMGQPYRKECMRIIATFLRPGAVKELPLANGIRDTAVRNLAHTTHPAAFLPVYHEMYNTLENSSIPNFLVHNTTLVNRPQQVYELTLGVAYILLGIAISLSLILTLRTPPHSRRAWRIFGCCFISMGMVNVYSAFRGFCSRMYVRGRVQLRVWELQDVDEEAKVFWAELFGLDEKSDQDLVQDLDPSPNEQTSFTGLSSAKDPFIYEPSISSIEHGLHLPKRRPYLIPTSASRNGFNRPPVFGPDKVVQDPRIKAAHRQIMNEVVLVGFVSIIVFAAIVIPIPSLNH